MSVLVILVWLTAFVRLRVALLFGCVVVTILCIILITILHVYLDLGCVL